MTDEKKWQWDKTDDNDIDDHKKPSPFSAPRLPTEKADTFVGLNDESLQLNHGR